MALTRNTPSLKRVLLPLLYLALITVLVSNFSYFPFGTAFRFSLAVSVFTLFLLLKPDMSPVAGGLVTGIGVVAFRVILGILLAEQSFLSAFWRHIPAGVFYLTLGLGMFLLRPIWSLPPIPVFGGLSLLDFFSNVVELLARGDFLVHTGYQALYLLGAVAIIRAALTTLAYTAWLQKEAIFRQEQRQRQFEKVLLITSDLHGETLYLENTLNEVERIMQKSYQLYHKLRVDRREEAEVALAVAREIHDAKKDFTRLAARLRSLLLRESQDAALALHVLVDVAAKANQALATQMGKIVQISVTIIGQADIGEYHQVLSIINNLMGNAIDAIIKQGEVKLTVEAGAGSLVVIVEDNGVGITQQDIPLIYLPGYTTKLDPKSGQSSTGLGLAQVKNIVEILGGAISVVSEEGRGTVFTVVLPSPEGVKPCRSAST